MVTYHGTRPNCDTKESGDMENELMNIVRKNHLFKQRIQLKEECLQKKTKLWLSLKLTYYLYENNP
jgi:hypothetical protein